MDIIIQGARQHNLKNIDLILPGNKLIVITGLSGSGKSSLAFDTLYAEGQRRYVESLSTYARQFLERMEKPAIDSIEGLSPAIAIEQKTGSHNPRSTVGTITEIYDYFRLLFARVGTPHCHECGQAISSQTLDQIVDKAMALPEKSRAMILSPVVANQKGSHDKLMKQLRKEGFARVRVDEEILDIDEAKILEPSQQHTIDVVVDRLIIKETIRNRLADSLELAASLSGGRVNIEIIDGPSIFYSETPVCLRCGIHYPDFSPASFSFNSPRGACPKCDGLGVTSEFDPDLIVPNPSLSLRQGAVALWANRSSVHFAEFLDALTTHYRTDIYTPFADLPEHFKQVLLFGSGQEEIPFYFERNNRRFSYHKTYEGIIPNLERRYKETDSSWSREDIKLYMNFRPCSECKGTKLNRASRTVKIGDKTISDITSLSVGNALAFFQNLALTGKIAIIADRILREIKERLGFLSNVGLPYLTLDRAANTLSGGESQRIRLATQIGSKLTGVLYVLDEPSIGLHQRDNQQLLSALTRMRDLGNTVVVVEHDEETIRRADHVVDMGPDAGVEGGKIVFSGTPDDLVLSESSLTGLYLSGKKTIDVPRYRRKGHGTHLVIKEAAQNNLKKIDVMFPLGQLICVTGVSGSGKSSLVLETLFRALSQRLYHKKIRAGKFSRLKGLEHIDKVIHIDQSSIGRTPRSNPATYTGLFTFIRELFSKTPESRMRGYKPGRFSFNVKGGRCEACSGDGIIKIEMHFLPDLHVKCDACQGKRYNRETLEVRYRGQNIVDVLNMTVTQALVFF